MTTEHPATAGPRTGTRHLQHDPFDGIDLDRVSGCLRTIGHPDRLRMIAMLLHEDLAVGELVRRVGLSQPTVSGHLRLLQSRGMLTSKRDGRRILYHVASPALPDICRCIRDHFGSCQVHAP